jgi:mRNA-degrading endonuclease toxin of MazEF toxin-antitoxin module
MVASTIRNIPVEVPLGPEDGMPRECVVSLDDILTLPKARLI